MAQGQWCGWVFPAALGKAGPWSESVGGAYEGPLSHLTFQIRELGMLLSRVWGTAERRSRAPPSSRSWGSLGGGESTEVRALGSFATSGEFQSAASVCLPSLPCPRHPGQAWGILMSSTTTLCACTWPPSVWQETAAQPVPHFLSAREYRAPAGQSWASQGGTFLPSDLVPALRPIRRTLPLSS